MKFPIFRHVCYKVRVSKIKHQHGFTLIELLIATAIAAILGTGLVVTTTQLFNTNSSITNHQVAIKQVQNAADYISRDAQQAQTKIQIFTSGSHVLTFQIPTSSDGATSITVVYTVNGGGTLTRAVGAMSQNIATNITSFTVTGGTEPYVSITSTIKSESETRAILLVQ